MQRVSQNCLFLGDLVASEVSLDLVPWELSAAQRWPSPDSSREGKAGLLPEHHGACPQPPLLMLKTQGSPLIPFS